MCHDARLLIANAEEALRRLCELPAEAPDNSAEMDITQAIHAANKHMADHMMHCPICRSA